MLSDVTEAGVILWIGVAVGLVGLAATASNGVALILRAIRAQLLQLKTRTRHQLARIFPSLRQSVTVMPLVATAVASANLVGVLTGTVTPPPDAPIEVQIEAIRNAIEALQQRQEQHERQHRERHDALSGRVDALSSEARDGLAALTKRLDYEESAAATADARGLGPVAFGFVMVAVPDHLASVSGIGAAFTAAALFTTAWTMQKVLPGLLKASAA